MLTDAQRRVTGQGLVYVVRSRRGLEWFPIYKAQEMADRLTSHQETENDMLAFCALIWIYAGPASGRDSATWGRAIVALDSLIPAWTRERWPECVTTDRAILMLRASIGLDSATDGTVGGTTLPAPPPDLADDAAKGPHVDSGASIGPSTDVGSIEGASPVSVAARPLDAERDRVWGELHGSAAHSLSRIGIGERGTVGYVRVDRLTHDCYRIDGDSTGHNLIGASILLADRAVAILQARPGPLPASPVSWPVPPPRVLQRAFALDLRCPDCHGEGFVIRGSGPSEHVRQCDTCEGAGYRVTGEALLMLLGNVRLRARRAEPQEAEPRAAAIVRELARISGDVTIDAHRAIAQRFSPAEIADAIKSGHIVADLVP